jgi:ATP-dependent helicase/nuclease subunit A
VEEDGKPTAIRPRHIAILFRRFRNFGADVTRPYVRAPEGRRIPHVLVGGRSFHECEEVIALRNALAAIEWPDDELSVFATLRGPFFALNDEALLLFRQEVETDGTLRTRRLNPMRPIDRATIPPETAGVADALELLRDLHIGRKQRPIAQTIMMLLQAVRAHAGLALWPTGEQALANTQRLIDVARQFERSASSFRAFVNKLDLDGEHGEADEAPIVEEGTEGVRLITVHKAKGLQFPVVILADPTCSAARDDPSRHVDIVRRVWLEPLCGSAPVELLEAAAEEQQREQDEAIRVAYVATTRARDLLVAPVCGDQAIDGWLTVLDRVLYPPHTARSTSSPSVGCPAFGADSVLERGRKGQIPPGGPVKPGLHHPIPGGPPIVWWDPSRVVLEVEEPLPLRHQQILETGSDRAAASEANHAAWMRQRESLLAAASEPSLSAKTVTSLARAPAAQNDARRKDETRDPAPVKPDVRVIVSARPDDKRPGGRRFGALVHAMLAAIDLDAAPEAIQGSAAALQHPILRRATASAAEGNIRRETPVLLRLEDGSVAEGVLDLAFREQTSDFDGWSVVDFKTDQEFSSAPSRYIAQVDLYVRAVQAATDLLARGIILVL